MKEFFIMPECQRSLQTHLILPARRRAKTTKTHPATTWSLLVCLLPPTRYVHEFFCSSIKNAGYLASTCAAAFRCNETRAGPVVWQQRSSSELRYISLRVLTSPFSQKTTTQLSCNCQVTKTTVLSTHPSALKSHLHPMMTMTMLGAEKLTDKTNNNKKETTP